MTVPLTGLTPAESHWIDYIWSRVTPRLLGNANERARTAALVTWWALKEGVLDVRPNPWRQNLCHTGGDHPIGDLEVCADPIWQVGMSGIQPSFVTLLQVENIANQIYPGENHQNLLRRIAQDAAVQNSNVIDAIVTSTGTLKKAWLLRDPAIAFTLQRPAVENGCIRGNSAWCYGTWDTARRFASSPSRVREVVDTLENYFRTAPMRGSEPSSSSRAKTILVLALLGAGAYYLYSTTSGKKLRRRIETKALSW